MSLIIRTLPVGQMEANCYLLIDSDSREALIVDPGDSADYIANIIRDEHVQPTNIIATHGHFDHIMAVTELKLMYGIPFLIHERDDFLVKRMQETALHFLKLSVDPPPTIDGNFKEGDELMVGKEIVTVIETPGHTPGSVCLYHKKTQTLLTGDTIFADGQVGRTDFSYSNRSDLEASLKKLFTLPPKTTIYPGHGATSTFTTERGFHSQ